MKNILKPFKKLFLELNTLEKLGIIFIFIFVFPSLYFVLEDVVVNGSNL